MSKILSLAKQAGELLKTQKSTIVTAESCTGGGLSYALTSIPGSSHWFDRGYVTYTEQAKIALLGISSSVLKTEGAVSQTIALAMAKNALTLSQASWCISVTGIAGPDGGTQECPVGTVWIAFANINNPPLAKKYLFKGDRLSIREQAIEISLTTLISLLSADI